MQADSGVLGLGSVKALSIPSAFGLTFEGHICSQTVWDDLLHTVSGQCSNWVCHPVYNRARATGILRFDKFGQVYLFDVSH